MGSSEQRGSIMRGIRTESYHMRPEGGLVKARSCRSPSSAQRNIYIYSEGGTLLQTLDGGFALSFYTFNENGGAVMLF